MSIVPLFLYIDEGGNFDFSPTGTRYYTLTGVVTHNSSILCSELNDKRNSILAGQELVGLGNIYLEESLSRKFHASEDKQVVRDEVFKIIQTCDKKYFRAQAVVIQKNKTNPTIHDNVSFYGKMVIPLLKFTLKGYQFSKLIIFLDNSPVNSRRSALVKNIKKTLAAEFPSKAYSLYCVPSESNYLLQVADYINWAIFKKWEGGDRRSYDLIKDYLEKDELDMFSKGSTIYY